MARGHTRRAWLASGMALAGGGVAGCATLPPPNAAHPAHLPGTRQSDLRDPASGRIWRVWMQQPSLPPPPDGYPLLCLSDGNASFALAAQLARNDESRPAELRPDPLLVVAIGHPSDAPYTGAWRQRDYTPPRDGSPPAGGGSGGAGVLLDFLAREVLPRCQRMARVDTARQTLFGHSLGGLLVLHALFQRPGLFTRHAAASPSLWWDGAHMLDEADRFVQRHAGPGLATATRLQLRVGGLEGIEAAVSPARAAVQRERRMIERTQELAARLAALRGLQVDFAIRPGLDHGDMMLHALLDAMSLARLGRA